ncbi:amidohydrolase family protein [Dasania sp. GY-MA-18]|uniref:Amidohydrolase family protein n=1 Tax=Dasania phycosphaerae TaxID=2950436 RepID=A0A9J6RHR9_9GAMM|nr:MULTISPECIES: amidohydrolase family protein [Dasania]MCR8921575.1 amidohydrolase family protein [Dasania sp. GY-MA-18]MCZ0864003.1 amidohydrolase family protein [Dasania phycosphaerae]MCZ0867731.1 amidohydrolase family protein [Dasania phycosphaerae]
MKPLLLSLIVLLSLTANVLANSEPLIYIKAGTLIEVVNGKVLKQQLITIQGEHIIAVAPTKSATLDPQAQLIDLSAYTVMPGLMDSHTHLLSSMVWGYDSLALSDDRLLIHGVVNAEKTLLAGYTSVRDVGAPGFADVALRDAINAGEIPGPRMLVSGPALGITGGHCDNNMLPIDYQVQAEAVANGPWAARAMVRKNIKYGADLIKFCGTGGVFSKGTKVGAQQYTLEEMRAIIDEAHMAGKKVAVHAHGTAGIKTAIKAGADSIEHASFLDEEAIKLAKKHGTYLSMDIYNDDFILQEGAKFGMTEESLAKEKHLGLTQRQSFQKAVKAGVNIAYGTDAGVYPNGENGKQMAKMVEWGMSAMQAVQTATLHTATLFGSQQQTGAITAGRLADIIAIKGDPLKDLSLFTQVSFVMKGGKIYKQP